MNITVFSKNNCMQCKMTKRFLNDNNITFREVNIDEQPEAISQLKEQGFQTVPVVTTDSQTIIGFRPDQLRQLAS
ncbi:glutaredoxin-like protein NrdH [Enterococcus mediterraneensis]|uniref:glutaredoxin-like protein NrdH n=1 Tax=Enterococcus mediterraneensis TaxID=2364791 RepID=UPI000F05CE36|nr:glutaredoxin-like protein NrdH [Enterococcus mediterraneensis]